jgi:CheY-like chemotaxis protein
MLVAMASHERRQSPDGRRHPRGGRRRDDQAGHSPLIFVVTRDPATRALYEQRLSHLRFAVIACNGAGPALEALQALRPDVIVAESRDVALLHDRLPQGRSGRAIPIVEFAAASDSIDQVIGDIRRVLGDLRRNAGH